jgi:Fic family protein
VGPERKQPDQHLAVMEFLRESNNIEGVWNQDSLNQAIKAWTYLAKEDRLFIETVLQTHKILMEGKLRPEDLGVFRKRPIRISGMEGKSWYLLPELMENWIGSVNEIADKSVRDENIIKKQHIDFEIIHPFADGNGRMGRILMNWTRIKVGLPILIIREREKQQYYGWFPHR